MPSARGADALVDHPDLSIQQEFFVEIGGRRNTIQLRADISNFANLRIPTGVGKSGVNNRLPAFTGKDVKATQPTSSRRFQALSLEVLKSRTDLINVWQAAVGVRYIFLSISEVLKGLKPKHGPAIQDGGPFIDENGVSGNTKT